MPCYKRQLAIVADMLIIQDNPRISLKNCQAGMVTALTTDARFLVLWKRLAAFDSAGFPSSSNTTRWMMLSVRDRLGRWAGFEPLAWLALDEISEPNCSIWKRFNFPDQGSPNF